MSTACIDLLNAMQYVGTGEKTTCILRMFSLRSAFTKHLLALTARFPGGGSLQQNFALLMYACR